MKLRMIPERIIRTESGLIMKIKLGFVRVLVWIYLLSEITWRTALLYSKQGNVFFLYFEIHPKDNQTQKLVGFISEWLLLVKISIFFYQQKQMKEMMLMI